eukprot:CAMPEP_0184866124 /NCGR_PEP_ID=MMETSP0580-20130426/20808_1 /TAXON_ID=1118495 /ORGANISM="Dactyliosolen fragilissimus" /LENGTH=264 /DNA_ID=CAMNT_0027365605 /DNA_START=91 /DNA_END=882 /DNA_ORIENTATION=+
MTRLKKMMRLKRFNPMMIRFHIFSICVVFLFISTNLYHYLSMNRYYSSGHEKPLSKRLAVVETGRKSLCILVRTYPKQRESLKTLLAGWDAIGSRSPLRAIHVFVTNTDASKPQNSQFIVESIDEIRARHVSMHFVPHDIRPIQSLYGYDVTQFVLDGIRNDEQYNCGTYLFTNGDNYYHPEILQRTGLDGLTIPQAQLIAVDFVSHHGRGFWRERPNQVIRTQFKRRHIDLGSAFVDHYALESCPEAGFHSREKDKENFALDW